MGLIYDPYSDINMDFREHQTVGVANFEQRPELLGKLWSYQYCYLFLADLMGEYTTTKKKDQPLFIAIYTAKIILYECNNLHLSFLYGGYTAAARTARLILETSLGSAAAILDASKLDAKTRNKSMELPEFINWLRRYDMNPGLLSRKNIYPVLNISKSRINKSEKNYKNLCKFSHLSTQSFTAPHTDPYYSTRFNVNPPLFKKVLSEVLTTIDLSMYCTLYTFTSITGRPWHVKKNFRGFMDSDLGKNDKLKLRKELGILLPSEIPMTWKLLNKITK